MNTILFAKTLLRKDVASSKSKSKSIDKKSDDNDDDDDEDNNISPDLISPPDETTAVSTEINEEAVVEGHAPAIEPPQKKGDDDEDFSSKSQIMTLMTTDVDRVADFRFVNAFFSLKHICLILWTKSWHAFSIVDAPIEIIIGSMYLYHLLGKFLLINSGV